MANPVNWQGATGHGYKTCEEKSLACSRAWKKPVRREKDRKEDEAMALTATLRKVSSGHSAEQPFQLIYILCLPFLYMQRLADSFFLKWMQWIHVISVLSAQRDTIGIAKTLYSSTGNSCTDFSKVTPDLKLVLIYICVKISPMCSRKHSAQLGQFRNMK